MHHAAAGPRASERINQAFISTRLHPAPRAAAAPVTRKDFTDRLGLPETATNAEVLDAVDKAAAKRGASRPASEEDALYALAFGGSDAQTARSQPSGQSADDELYALAFGR